MAQRRPKSETVKTTLRDALDSAAMEIDALRDEMESWRDNLSGANMEHLPKYEEVSECAERLADANVQERVERLIAALELACEGTEFRPGCPGHVVGQKCARCRWDGRLPRPEPLPTLVEVENPTPRLREYTNAPSEWLTDVARVLYSVFAVRGEQPSAEDIERCREDARREWWFEAERIHAENERRCRPPARLPDEPAIAPRPGFDAALLDAAVEWQEYQKRRPSRSDRLGSAMTALATALDVLEAKLGEGTDELREAVEEVREALGELEGIDFPGMFG